MIFALCLSMSYDISGEVDGDIGTDHLSIAAHLCCLTIIAHVQVKSVYVPLEEPIAWNI